jgi:hypothetical protein
MLKKYSDLSEEAKKQVKQRYVHWHYDKTSNTFVDWAHKNSYYVRLDGLLDNRYKHCEPYYMAD